MKRLYMLILLCLASSVLMTACVSYSSSGISMPVPLEATQWQLVQIQGKDIGDLPKPPTLKLNPTNNHLAGSAGCNRYMGQFTATHHQISFSKMASTMMACNKGMKLEKQFLKTFEQVTTWWVEGNKLELSDDSGKVLLLFKEVKK